ncbi:hypothetical protein L1987_23982 [Smallanthus sonchifolius]|uniref:Uncharacterized protein n=1 Tax=Smallanthus sonchifolius TaxID=185202 RepID=A0ACB9IJR8_9ASTR|nr:hypothetical protein L1987_23982 [Smallanthus sonchifolius]
MYVTWCFTSNLLGSLDGMIFLSNFLRQLWALLLQQSSISRYLSRASSGSSSSDDNNDDAHDAVDVSSSSSSSDDAARQGEKESKTEEIFYHNSNEDSLAHNARQSSPLGEVILSPNASPAKTIDKGKKIIEDSEIDTSKSKPTLSKEMEEELSLKTIEAILIQDEIEAQVERYEVIAKKAVDSLRSILSKELEKKKEDVENILSVPRHFARVYLRRKLPKDGASIPPVSTPVDSSQAESSKVHSEKFVQPEAPKVQSTPESIQKETEIPKTTPRKKSIPKRVIKKHMEVVVPDKEKYKKLYENVGVTEFSERDT